METKLMNGKAFSSVCSGYQNEQNEQNLFIQNVHSSGRVLEEKSNENGQGF